MKPSLLNDILQRGVKPINDTVEAVETTRLFLQRIELATPFVADNVAQWLYQQEGRIGGAADLLSITPPFGVTWIEWPDLLDEGIDRVGVLIICADYADDEDGGTASVRSLFRWYLEGNRVDPNETRTPDWETSDHLRFFMVALPIARAKGAGPVGPIKTWFGALTPQGTIAKASDGMFMEASLYFSGIPARTFEGLIVEGFVTLSFLNCRNVTTEEHLPSRQQRRAAQRKGEPVTTFRTLSIEPMRKVLVSEGGLEQNGLKKALHICRGHFANYSEDKPLFGKYSGQFWIPAHVRGSQEVGTIVKDYRVKAPRA